MRTIKTSRQLFLKSRLPAAWQADCQMARVRRRELCLVEFQAVAQMHLAAKSAIVVAMMTADTVEPPRSGECFANLSMLAKLSGHDREFTSKRRIFF